MSDSSREQDARKAKREAARQLKSAETSFRHWAKRAGGSLAIAFGEKTQKPQPKGAGAEAGRGTAFVQRRTEMGTSLPQDVLLQIFLRLPTSGTCYILGQLLLYTWTSPLGVGVWCSMKKDNLPLFLLAGVLASAAVCQSWKTCGYCDALWITLASNLWVLHFVYYFVVSPLPLPAAQLLAAHQDADLCVCVCVCFAVTRQCLLA